MCVKYHNGIDLAMFPLKLWIFTPNKETASHNIYLYRFFFSSANCKSVSCVVSMCYVGSTVCLQSVSMERCYIECVVHVELVKEKVKSLLDQECKGDIDHVSLEPKSWYKVYRPLTEWFIFAHVLAGSFPYLFFLFLHMEYFCV